MVSEVATVFGQDPPLGKLNENVTSAVTFPVKELKFNKAT